MGTTRRAAVTALILSTIAFTACFACWVQNAVLVTHLVESGAYRFDRSQIGWLLAAPILTGAVSRVPLGMLTDRYGGRIVFPLLMLVAAAALVLLSRADGYAQFLVASLAFGLAGGSFAVGVGYLSLWFPEQRQGTALGLFGIGNAGAALTTIAAPPLLARLTGGAAGIEGWRRLPLLYAALLVAIAAIFALLAGERRAARRRTLLEQFAPLRSIVVWRFGLYYALVFGSFVAVAQWIVPYGVGAYRLSVAEAGLLAAVFSLPSGLVRAAGGWLSDRYGARLVLQWVLGGCIASCLLLAVPRLDIHSPGEGILARRAGVVGAVSSERIEVGPQRYRLFPLRGELPAQREARADWLPRWTTWHEPVVAAGAHVEQNQLLARGRTNIYYPANVWLFAGLVFVFGLATGVGKAAVYKFIPDQFPGAVGAVGGMVGLLGALGGVALVPLFGLLLRWTGLWSSCWILLGALSAACLVSLHLVLRRMMQESAPELARLIERQPTRGLVQPISLPRGDLATTLVEVLAQVPLFADLPREQLIALSQAGRIEEVEADRLLLQQDQPGEVLYVLLDGAALVQRDAAELARLQPGDHFGELALIDGQPRSASVRTMTPCSLFLIERRDFLLALSRSPAMLAHVLIGLSAMIRRAGG